MPQLEIRAVRSARNLNRPGHWSDDGWTYENLTARSYENGDSYMRFYAKRNCYSLRFWNPSLHSSKPLSPFLSHLWLVCLLVTKNNNEKIVSSWAETFFCFSDQDSREPKSRSISRHEYSERSMFERFDPRALLIHQNHHHPNSHSHGSSMQSQFQQPNNPFGNSFGAAGFGVGEKRNNCRNENENVDCNLLQSSLKRVRLSRSPGEFRLQRDLKTLNSEQWGSSHHSPNAMNFSSTTWIHRSTGTRLTMVDSLRICLFLPLTALQDSGQQTSDASPQQLYQHQNHSYHRDYRWRIMIQLPRMYPHSPPVVTRVDGLALDSIIIKEQPPGTNFLTETQLARSQSTSGTQVFSSSTLGGKTVEWNQWSPIAGLGELLDFLMQVAVSNPYTGTGGSSAAGSLSGVTNSMMGTNHASIAVATGRTSSSSSSLSSVSSASSLSSWGNRNIMHNGQGVGNNTVAADTSMMTADETASTRSNVSGASFLSPNRFDVGYGKSESLFGTTPRATNTSAAWQQQIPIYRGKEGDEDIGMDMS